ncbi:hypothetical protein J8273_1583 [Carpediemonas membranifera]|uniref:Uncharacterized protein n=1 Tax=Carpediemonas membranifera TaxID=201153 RepID=A0A8J6B0B7_9EUKA|nr:hypothetical protein J8273_1583 [Carpediemonas membranifera]|eukprot:KAG9396575.1 hypothetical protein J8273_1583 [Carpediemonas membranifera]
MPMEAPMLDHVGSTGRMSQAPRLSDFQSDRHEVAKKHPSMNFGAPTLPNLQTPDDGYYVKAMRFKRYLYLLSVLEYVILMATYMTTFSVYIVGPVILGIMFFEHRRHRLLLLSLCVLMFSTALVFSEDAGLLSMPWFFLRHPRPIIQSMPSEFTRILVIVTHHALFVALVLATTSCDCRIFTPHTVFEALFIPPAQSNAQLPSNAGSTSMGQYGSRLRDLTETLRQGGLDTTILQADPRN